MTKKSCYQSIINCLIIPEIFKRQIKISCLPVMAAGAMQKSRRTGFFDISETTRKDGGMDTGQ
jgi:hypothetical protein